MIRRSICYSKSKKYCPWTYVINDLNGEEITGTFYEKELQKTNQEEFRIENVIDEKEINFMLNGRNIIIHLIVGLIKQASFKERKKIL